MSVRLQGQEGPAVSLLPPVEKTDQICMWPGRAPAGALSFIEGSNSGPLAQRNRQTSSN